MVSVLTTTSVILGIIVSCMKISKALRHKTPPARVSPPAIPQQYPPYCCQQYPSPHVSSPAGKQKRTSSCGGCVGTTIGILVTLLLLAAFLLLFQHY